MHRLIGQCSQFYLSNSLFLFFLFCVLIIFCTFRHTSHALPLVSTVSLPKDPQGRLRMFAERHVPYDDTTPQLKKLQQISESRLSTDAGLMCRRRCGQCFAQLIMELVILPVCEHHTIFISSLFPLIPFTGQRVWCDSVLFALHQLSESLNLSHGGSVQSISFHSKQREVSHSLSNSCFF